MKILATVCIASGHKIIFIQINAADPDQESTPAICPTLTVSVKTIKNLLSPELLHLV
jgi:hypothetical protein